MRPEMQAPAQAGAPIEASMKESGPNGVGSQTPGPAPDPPEFQGFDSLIIGRNGLRAGWSIVIFVMLYRLFSMTLGAVALGIYPSLAHFDFSPVPAMVNESVPFFAMLLAAALVALFEHRRIVDYNLAGPRRGLNFLSGMAAGFLALSSLVGALALGGWLHFGPVALSGASVPRFGFLWACTFLLVAGMEEGIFRCFLQFTLARSVNFWWALAIVSVACLDLGLRSRGQMGIITFIWFEPLSLVSSNSAWGVYAIALLGLFPCLALHRKNASGSGFWQAVWVTSTLFGFVHTGNNGENWIGIFAAAAIGFVFCVGIWVTGSAWWAIGCHAAWDWAETYFYGTADSGLTAKGHFLTSGPTGNALWSGGTDGPEGSVLVLGAILLLLVALVAIYGRKRATSLSADATG